MKNLAEFIVDVPDFPKAGVLFRDFSPLLRSHFNEAVDRMSDLLSPGEWHDVDVVAGIESRGFIFASSLAYRQRKGLAMIRKEGKTPNAAAQAAYTLEYGTATLEMQAGQGRCLIIDDVLATGGTFKAAADLCLQAGFDVCGFAALINLKTLNSFQWRGHIPRAVMAL